MVKMNKNELCDMKQQSKKRLSLKRMLYKPAANHNGGILFKLGT